MIFLHFYPSKEDQFNYSLLWRIYKTLKGYSTMSEYQRDMRFFYEYVNPSGSLKISTVDIPNNLRRVVLPKMYHL